MTINFPSVPGTLLPAGPAGLTGQQGPQGQNGPQGTTGPQGVRELLILLLTLLQLSIRPASMRYPALPQPLLYFLAEYISAPLGTLLLAHSTHLFWRQNSRHYFGANSINGVTGPVVIAPGGGGNVSTSGSTVLFSVPGGDLNAFRNAHMDIAQRGTTGTVSSGATSYTLDGWQVSATGAAAAWSQQFNQNMAGNALRIACATGLTSCILKHFEVLKRLNYWLLINYRRLSLSNGQYSIIPVHHLWLESPRSVARLYKTTSTSSADLAATNIQTAVNGSVTTLSLCIYTERQS